MDSWRGLAALGMLWEAVARGLQGLTPFADTILPTWGSVFGRALPSLGLFWTGEGGGKPSYLLAGLVLAENSLVTIGRVLAGTGAGIVLMHMKGEPQTMQTAPCYEDVVDEVKAFLLEREAAAASHGVLREQIAFDPGIGFGKTLQHNLELFRRKPELLEEKGFMGRIRIMMFPRLGARMERDKGQAPRIEWDRETFGFSEAATYFEFAVENLVREGI